tara:strand:- start:880 stop:1386 length:507 start_codon:yes stop_codon:yes gene_type:complete
MKILSGKFKNFKVDIRKNSSFRPTTSICRKSFFDSIGSIDGLNFLDLFSGSGVNGFEAASRGAKKVTFVEIDGNHLNSIIKNAKNFPYEEFSFFKRDANRFIKKSDKYDIIFADPPYGHINIKEFADDALEKINPNGILVVECSEKESVEGCDKITKFGDTKLLYWKK